MVENAALTPWPAAAPPMLVIGTPDRLAGHARIADAIGARLVGQVAPDAAIARIRDQIALDLVLFDSNGVAEAEARGLAEALETLAPAHGCRIVALLDPATIDAVAPPLVGASATLLCDPGAAELAAALTAAMPGPARVQDATRERETERLRVLNEEVARLAEVLSQLAAERNDAGVRAPATAFRAEPANEPDADPRAVRATIRARRLRDQHFPADLFADPAWDMLLDLYAAWLEGRRVSVSSLCIAAAVPPTTALRWIGTLHYAGLFERAADPTDKRRAHIMLTDRARGGMRGYFAAAARAGLLPG
jgi:hypothetical protein